MQLHQSWEIAARGLGLKDSRYLLNCIYIEFANGYAPGDIISTPAVLATDKRHLYDALAGDAQRDYLRLPILPGTQLSTSPGFETEFIGGGNTVTVMARSGESVGMNGKPFTQAAGSAVIGIAIVAAPSWDDFTQDLLYSRRYYQTSPINQQQRIALGSQIAVDCELAFLSS